MKVRFKTAIRDDKGTAKAGTERNLPDAVAKSFIVRGLAVACDDEKAQTAAEKKAADEKAKAEKAAQEAAEKARLAQEGGAQ